MEPRIVLSGQGDKVSVGPHQDARTPSGRGNERSQQDEQESQATGQERKIRSIDKLKEKSCSAGDMNSK